MKAVILGATRGMGRSLARLMAERGDDLVLLGRNAADLEKSAADLRVRGNGARVAIGTCDLADPATFLPALDAADEALGTFDCAIITAAQFGTQQALEDDTDRTRDVLDANFTNTIVLCEHIRKRLLARGGGTLCVFSSVAGDRARKPVILYGATKAGLTHYLDGLDHKFRADGLVTVAVRPGFVKTSMTAGLKPPPFAGEPEGVAKTVLKAIDKGTPVVYAPPIWGLVMLVIRQLPRFVMRRIGF